MPRALDPHSHTFEAVLACDAELENPPTFVCRYVTFREMEAFGELEQAKTAADVGRMFDLLGSWVIDWRNMIDHRDGGRELEYSPDRLRDVLSPSDVFDLVQAIAVPQAPTVDDLGNSESRPESLPGESAPAAGREAAENGQDKRPASSQSASTVRAEETPAARAAPEPAGSS